MRYAIIIPSANLSSPDEALTLKWQYIATTTSFCLVAVGNQAVIMAFGDTKQNDGDSVEEAEADSM